MNITHFLLLVTLLLVGCNIKDSKENPGSALLRIDNASSADFVSVVVGFLGNKKIFGNISHGQQSRYKKFDAAYRYGFIEVESSDTTYRLTPIDYVGESPLDHGRYTFELDIVDEHLKLEFRPE